MIGAANNCIFFYLLTSTLICIDSFLNGKGIGFNFAFITAIEFISIVLIRATGKAHIFSERMFIWQQVTSKIISCPIFGYGSLKDSIVYDCKGYLRTTHNNFFQICQMGGNRSYVLSNYVC